MELLLGGICILIGVAIGFWLARYLYNVSSEKQSELNQQTMQLQERLLAAERQNFESLAHKILEVNANKFSEQSHKNLSNLLDPLKEKLVNFEKKVTDTFSEEARQRYTLKGEIDRIIEANNKIHSQAENLAKALKGESKIQGDWGEMILEKILEDSGLRKDLDYIPQAREMDLRGIDGQLLKPDYIIKLPENKHIIVDSKASIKAYADYCNNTVETEKLICQKQLIDSIRNHVKNLASKRYQETNGLGTPDFVLMFIPIEGAYNLALQQDKDLHTFAWNLKVAIVCPSTLFVTLRTIASLWRIDLQNKHALKIAEESGALYDKFVGFVDDMQTIGKSLDTTRIVYDSALNKLSTGRGNVVKRLEEIKKLGAKASKSLPDKLLSISDNENQLS